MSHTRPFAIPVLVAIGLTAPGCGDGGRAPASARAPQAVDVSLQPVRVGSLPRSTEVTGTLYGEEETTISAKLAGRIAQIRADIGDPVLPGAALAILETADYELALAERRAALRAALARLALTEPPDESFDPQEVPSVARARAEAANADARFQRGRLLFEENPPLISEEELADLRTAWEVALSSADEALVAARALLAESRTLAAQVAVSEQRLTDTAIRTPGREGESSPRYFVAQRLVSLGEYVIPGREAFRLVASDLIKFRADVPERFVGDVRPGQDARIWVDAYQQAAFGTVARVSPSIDPLSRTFEVEIHIQNADGRLKPGGFARGRIVTRIDEGVTFVPESAIVTFAGVHRVYTVRDGKAVEHRIRPGDRIEGWVEIPGPLPAGEVVASSAAQLTDGTPVQVTAPGGASAAGPQASPDSR